MKHYSYTIDGIYRAQPESAQMPENAENVQEFDSIDALHDSQEFKAYKASIEVSSISQEDQVILGGFSHNGKVTPITDLLYFIQLAKAGKNSLEDSNVLTETVTIPCIDSEGKPDTYEADLALVNKIEAALESIRSNSIKVGMGKIDFESVIIPHIL